MSAGIIQVVLLIAAVITILEDNHSTQWFDYVSRLKPGVFLLLQNNGTFY